MQAARSATLSGIGIGFIADWDRDGTDHLIEMLPPLEDWTARVWLVTHMDLHRTARCKALCGSSRIRSRAGG